MLDMYVFKWFHRLAWKPYVKASARHIPLSATSCHSPSCHRSWPVGKIRRMHSRSCIPRHFQSARQAKLDRFRHFFMDPSVWSMAANWAPPIAGITQWFPSPKLDPRKVIRVIFPFSRKWAGLSKKIRDLESSWLGLFRNAGLNLSVQVSFSNGGVPLWARLRSKVHPSLELLAMLRA